MTRRRGARVPGHKLTVESSDERGAERSATGTCLCGWQESASSQAGVREEYGWHLDRVVAS